MTSGAMLSVFDVSMAASQLQDKAPVIVCMHALYEVALLPNRYSITVPNFSPETALRPAPCCIPSLDK
jgi:hypothetical protein